jgi:hypothetical protein
MSSFEDIDRYYKLLEKGIPKPNAGVAYTCNCGWIDAGHANSRSSVKPNIGAANLWANIKNESDMFCN